MHTVDERNKDCYAFCLLQLVGLESYELLLYSKINLYNFYANLS